MGSISCFCGPLSRLFHFLKPTTTVTAYAFQHHLLLPRIEKNLREEMKKALHDTVETALAANQDPNLPAPREYFTNPRGQRLSVQTSLPFGVSAATNNSVPIRGYILFLHGYCAHTSRPIHTHMRDGFCRNGFAYITMDFHGHGRSQGTRGLVQDSWDLVDDVLSCLLALFCDADCSTNGDRVSTGLLDKQEINLRIPQNSNVPIYFIGHSMGGGVAIMTGHVLTRGGGGESGGDSASIYTTAYYRNNKSAIQRIGQVFRGALLFSPLIEINLPSFLKYVLVAPLVCCCPDGNLPAIFSGGPKTNEKIWSDPVYRVYCARDQWPANPNGLSYGGPMRLLTLQSLMTMSEIVLEMLPSIQYPFIIWHDPLDAITKYTGSVKAKTLSPSPSKCLKNMPDYLHDIIGNDIQTSLSECLQWLSQQEERYRGDGDR